MGFTTPDPQCNNIANSQPFSVSSKSSSQSPQSGKGCTLFTLLLVSVFILVISMFIFIIFPSSPIVLITVNSAQVGSCALTLITLTVTLADLNIKPWLVESDKFLARHWPKLDTSKLSKTTLMLLSIIIILLTVISISVLDPSIPIAFHNMISPPVHAPISYTSASYISVDPKTDIGISDGGYHFLKSNTLGNRPNPETLIYKENQNIDSSYVTMVVVGPLVQGGRHFSIGYDTLQAAYVLQNEADKIDGCFKTVSTCIHVRLLIANAGDNLEDAPKIADQITHIASDPTQHLIGCFGFPMSTPESIDAVKLLTANKIPVISSTASSDFLTAISPYFFHVAPIDNEQGLAAAQYIETAFPHDHHVLVLYAPGNPYSLTLASGFMSAFIRQPNNRIIRETYDATGKSEDREAQIANDLTIAFHGSDIPDLIYFPGYSDNLNKVLILLRTRTEFQAYSTLPIFSGDGAYDLSGYTQGNYGSIFYTAFASPDEWG